MLVVGWFNRVTIQRIYTAIYLFTPEKMSANFRSLDQAFKSRIIAKGDYTWHFGEQPNQLPDFYAYQGKEKSIQDFIGGTNTTGLIVSDGRQILFEAYYDGNTADDRVITWSVSKSIVSALIGIAIEEGYIERINDPLVKYAPRLINSGYKDVTIKQALQMTSGIRFNEDYGDTSSDVNRMGGSLFAFNRPLAAIVLTLENERAPGTFNRYVSADTQVLGMVLRSATGKTVTDYTSDKLWKPLGMSADASWLIDAEGMEAVFAGLSMTLRDMMRFGVLYMNKGEANGVQVVPEHWIMDSITPDSEPLLPGENPLSDWVMGYGYQWWLPESEEGEFMAMGIYGQAIYINPARKIVIAKTSAHNEYVEAGEDMELESVFFFRGIADHLGSED